MIDLNAVKTNEPWRRAPACIKNNSAGPAANLQSPFLFIGILSSPKNWKLRQAQREIWTTQPLFTSGRVVYRYFVGRSSTKDKAFDDQVNSMVKEEASEI